MYLVLCNCPPAEAHRIARTLVEERLAACVNIISGVTSVYTWKNELCEDTEHTLLIKTSADRFSDLEARLIEVHPYETPEIIGWSPDAVHKPYLAWLHDVTRAPERPA